MNTAPTPTQNYIETTGEGNFTQVASCFIAHVSLEIRAPQKEQADSELDVLGQLVLQTLVEAGIEKNEIMEGGTKSYPGWIRKGNKTRSIVLKVTDYARLIAALSAIEPLEEHARHEITVTMNQPKFDPSRESHAKALSESFEDAQQKARTLAISMGVELGRPILFVEGKIAMRPSDFSGDRDYRGDSDRYSSIDALTVDMSSNEEYETFSIDLQAPTRDLWVRCVVRFAIS